MSLQFTEDSVFASINITKRTSKAVAFDTLKQLIAGKGDTSKQLAALYSHLYPMPAVKKDDFAWVASAAGTDLTRRYLTVVNVINGMMYASDGHRIHRAPTTLEDGYYNAKTKTPVKMELQYPDVESFYEQENGKAHTVSLESVSINRAEIDSYNLHDFLNISVKYMNQANSNKDTVTYVEHGKERPVIIKDGKREAVVMPIRKEVLR